MFSRVNLLARGCALLLGIAGISGQVALAESDTTEGEYQVPKGEQPVYGKKYYPNNPMGNPDERGRNVFLELNPAMLLKRGIEFEFEARMAERVTLGADLFYAREEPSVGRVSASSAFFALAPKVRVYPMEYLGGVFFGFKMYMGLASWEINSTAQLSGREIAVDRSDVAFAPCAHVGYRFNAWSQFSFSVYAGGGYHLPPPSFSKGLSTAERDALRAAGEEGDWDKMVSDLKKEYQFRPDFGLTIGVFL